MFEPVRNPRGVLAALQGACERWPDQRVMQVVVNALGNDPFYVEDEEAIEKLVEYATFTGVETRTPSTKGAQDG